VIDAAETEQRGPSMTPGPRVAILIRPSRLRMSATCAGTVVVVIL
jgi:hypothetical protein